MTNLQFLNSVEGNLYSQILLNKYKSWHIFERDENHNPFLYNIYLKWELLEMEFRSILKSKDLDVITIQDIIFETKNFII